MLAKLAWTLLLGLAAVAVIVLAMRGGALSDVFGPGDWPAAAFYAIWLVPIIGTLLVMFRGRGRQALEAALLWLLVAGVLVIGYTYRTELAAVRDRVLGELLPGRPVTQGRIVQTARGQSGDFTLRAAINGAAVTMVLDTGASSIVLTQAAAKAAGLPLEVLQYTVPVDTANGRTRAAAVTLDEIAVGSLVEKSVPALVAQPGQLRSNLLGLSFLNRLESWEVRGDSLVLRGYP